MEEIEKYTQEDLQKASMYLPKSAFGLRCAPASKVKLYLCISRRQQFKKAEGNSEQDWQQPEK
jgi:hypothetical protein